ncbi:MAG: DUF2723 domain-containing protein [Bacteroidales bacterium]|nr:DUF2723 domain-containing protein [Bacteroidales bacterium]
MDNKKFNLMNRICAALSLVVSAVTYLLTMEPSASFWDCGEFIASSYKLEVGHPPGNPMFQLIARFFTLFGDNMHAAVMVNAMSAVCSALTIFLLYLTIVFFVRRISSNPVAICGSALVGALAYCFSDTFWFSAVEGEVYAMSSLFTALVFWAMTKWYEQADSPRANRWIVLIAFLMGLSIGVHLLNLLAIPALVFMFYYRRREDRPFKFKELLKIFLIGVAILAVILFVIVPVTPKCAAYFDLFFVNVLGLPYNTGASVFVLLLLGTCFWGLFRTMKKGLVFWNTALLCLTAILIGFSVFSVCVIRSCAKTPTNEYQPDNAFTLVRYLNREQYGSSPLIYGQYYGAPYDIKVDTYWAPLNGRYKKSNSQMEAEYKKEGKMLFPRMWSTSPDGRHERFYERYTEGKGHRVAGSDVPKPSFGANLAFFFDYQLNWMYWRYFMWNFVGRQNEIHSPDPGDLLYGNWESGIGFIDRIRLGDQSDAPSCLSGNKGKNHYYFLPLLLGLLGLFFQFDRDRRGCWLIFLMFFMTGIAIVIYLNQPPFQVRERDYAYAGSFYFFSVWIGLAVAAITDWIRKGDDGKSKAVAAAVTVACLFVPALMAARNWDDHDRSGRKTAAEIAGNYLNSVPRNGILITHGDNDTFPLWYAQEVENVRPDVRIVNTSLLGTDWHIDQMKYAVNESAPLPLTVGQEQYLYGTNDFIPIRDDDGEVKDIKDVMAVFRHPALKTSYGNSRVDYINSRRIRIPVNKENVIRCGILDERYADRIPDSIVFTMSPDKHMISKGELFLLDFLSNYQWDRPLCMLSMGGELNVGQKEYLQYRGLSWMLVPIRSSSSTNSPGFADEVELHRLVNGEYKWDALASDGYFIDYQNNYTFLGVVGIRSVYHNCATIFLKTGHPDWAAEALDVCMNSTRNYDLVTIPIGIATNDYMMVQIISDYFLLGQDEKAGKLAEAYYGELLPAIRFFVRYYALYKNESEMLLNCAGILAQTMKENGRESFAEKVEKDLSEAISGLKN